MLGLRHPEDERDFFRRFGGEPLLSHWDQPEALEIREPTESPHEVGDVATWVTGMPVLSARALSVLEPILHENAEALPIRWSGGDFFLLNVTRLLGALVESNSEIFRYPSGEIGDIVRYELDPAIVAGRSIFKLTRWPLGKILVGQHFVDAVLGAGLVGFEFKQVWPTPGQWFGELLSAAP